MFKKDFKNDIEGCVIQAEFVEYERTLVMDAAHITDPDLTSEGFRLLAYIHTLGKTFKPNRKAMIKFMGSEHRLNKAMADLKKLGYLLTVARKNEAGKFCGQTWLAYKTKDKTRHANFKQQQTLKKISFNIYQAAKVEQLPKPKEIKESTELRISQHGKSENSSQPARVVKYGDTVNHNALQRSYSYEDSSLSPKSSLSKDKQMGVKGIEERDFKDFSKTSMAMPDAEQILATPDQVMQAIDSLAGSKGFDTPALGTPRLRAEANARDNESEIERKRRAMQEQYEAMQRGAAPLIQQTTVKADPVDSPPGSAAPPRGGIAEALRKRTEALAARAAREAEENPELHAKRAEIREALTGKTYAHPMAGSNAQANTVDVERYAGLSPADMVEKLYSEHISNPEPLKDKRNIKRFKEWFEKQADTVVSSVVEAFKQAKQRGAYSIVSVERNLQAMGFQCVS